MTSSYITVAEAVSWIAHKDFAAFGEYYKLRSHKTWKTENPVELLSCLQEMLEERDEEYLWKADLFHQQVARRHMQTSGKTLAKLIADLSAHIERENADGAEYVAATAKLLDAARSEHITVLGVNPDFDPKGMVVAVPLDYLLQSSVKLHIIDNGMSCVPENHHFPRISNWSSLKVRKSKLLELWPAAETVESKPYARTKKPATKALAIAEKLRQLSKLPTSVTKSMENTYEANRKTILVAIKMVEEERSRENAG